MTEVLAIIATQIPAATRPSVIAAAGPSATPRAEVSTTMSSIGPAQHAASATQELAVRGSALVLGGASHDGTASTVDWGAGSSRAGGRSSTRRRSWALRATTMVETLIRIAARAGGMVMPAQMSAPAAMGIATML